MALARSFAILKQFNAVELYELASGNCNAGYITGEFHNQLLLIPKTWSQKMSRQFFIDHGRSPLNILQKYMFNAALSCWPKLKGRPSLTSKVGYYSSFLQVKLGWISFLERKMNLNKVANSLSLRTGTMWTNFSFFETLFLYSLLYFNNMFVYENTFNRILRINLSD